MIENHHETIKYAGVVMQYTLIRSKRKTLSIHVRDTGVEVRAPLKMPARDIERFVASKEKWIVKGLMTIKERAKQRELFALNYGEAIMLRGMQRVITAKSEAPHGFYEQSLYLPPGLTASQIKSACVKRYRKAAGEYLRERVDFYSQKIGVSPEIIRINSAKKRWGSCSSKRSVNFSWRLIMADDEVIDYVVVHELAHLIHMNHSAGFWLIVEKMLPDFRERRQRLKELGERLGAQDWD